MNFDFSFLLVMAALLTGVVVLIDNTFFASKRKKRQQEQETELINTLAKRKGKQKHDSPDLEKLRKKQLPVLVDYSRSLFPVLFIVLIARSFFFEPYQIPSGSMLPTLRIGDFILVNKFTYGVRLPVINVKIFPGIQPKRGQVLVFRAPFEPHVNFIKRVVGLPGDSIEIVDSVLYINGARTRQGMMPNDSIQQQYPGYHIFQERLDDTTHLMMKGDYYTTSDGRWTVPEDSYFVLGDNRGNSHDSRFWGFVPDDHIVGQAVYVWMHWDNFLSIPGFQSVGTIDNNL